MSFIMRSLYTMQAYTVGDENEHLNRITVDVFKNVFESKPDQNRTP